MRTEACVKTFFPFNTLKGLNRYQDGTLLQSPSWPHLMCLLLVSACALHSYMASIIISFGHYSKARPHNWN